MENSRIESTSGADSGEDVRAWYAFGWWVRAVYAGVLAILIGAGALQRGRLAPAIAFAVLLAGIALAAFAWRRAAAIVAQSNATEPGAASRAGSMRARSESSRLAGLREAAVE